MDKQIVVYEYNITQQKRIRLLIYTAWMCIKSYTMQNKQDRRVVHTV